MRWGARRRTVVYAERRSLFVAKRIKNKKSRINRDFLLFFIKVSLKEMLLSNFILLFCVLDYFNILF